ncbi:MAG: hypothetical protein JW791_03470 [Nanoarchaeota archaeon]|nr:hypothetical protein [Nanoarchaeota archaeon]
MGKRDVVPFGIKGFDKIIEGVPPGSCLLLISPPMIETRLFCTEFIFRGLQEDIPALFIEMDDSPEQLKLKALRYNLPLVNAENKNLLKWIDGYSARARKTLKDTKAIKRVSGPLALSDISIAISGAQSLFNNISDTYKLVFDSVSTLLLYNNPETIYRFLQVITAKIKNSDGVALFVLGQGMHDSQVEMTIRHMMDGTIILDEDLTMNIVSFPITISKKKASLNLTKKGFEVKTD